MEVSISKPGFIGHKVDESIMSQINGFLPYQIKYLNEGFKYQGCFLKPNCYRIID